MSAVVFRNFGFEDQLVRMIDREGAPWFVAQDICSCLEIKNYRDAVGKLDDDERAGVEIADALGRQQFTSIVNESGVYSLALRCHGASRPGSAPWRFRKWVTAEVLPTLRRTGSYEMPKAANDIEPEPAPMPEPSDLDERGMALAISVVREARQVWGRNVAKRIWRQMGLPEPDETNERLLAARARIDQSLHDWMAERTALVPDAFTGSSQLYRSYTNWCESQEIEPISMTRFGTALEAMGYHRKKDERGCMMRRGLALI